MILTFASLLFLTVVMLSAGFFIERSGSGTRVVAERLRRLTGSRADGKKDVGRDERYSRMRWLDSTLRGVNIGRHLEFLIYQAGMGLKPGALVLVIASAAMAGYFIGVTAFHRVMPGLVFLLLFGPAPYFYVRYRKFQRMKAFAREFPDALDLLVSGLRAGLSLQAAMQILAEESPEPVRSEFAITVEEHSLGLDFREAMINLTHRVDVLDLRFFVTALLLQRETGGNLAEVLSKTASLIRERFQVLGDIQTFTAQGKLTGVILVCLPIGVGVFTWLTAPDYFAPMIHSEAGKNGLIAAVLMQLAGIGVIFKIVNIKV